MTRLVYFVKPVGMAGPIKIGRTYLPIATRLSQMASNSPLSLELIHVVASDKEHAIHCHFADAHSHGEWFHPIPRLLAAIEALKAGKAVEDAIDLADIRGNIRRGAVVAAWARKRERAAA